MRVTALACTRSLPPVFVFVGGARGGGDHGPEQGPRSTRAERACAGEPRSVMNTALRLGSIFV